MKMPPAKTPAAPQSQQAAARTIQPAYQAPRVQDLGEWQAVTLICSVQIIPGTPPGNTNC